uniref:Putative secreted protein n=1 Tax=Ixodes ricinus TaxID=34613 RepID=A0A6B0U9D8_IXORI
MVSRFRRRRPPLFLLVFFPRCFVRLGEEVNQNGNNRNAGSACETNFLPSCVVFIDCCTTHLPHACEQTVADRALWRAQFFRAHALKPPVTASSWPFHRASFASVCS